MSEINTTAVKKTRRVRHTGRGSQVRIYLGKQLRFFINENDWKVLPMAAVIAALVAMVILLVWPVGHAWRRMARNTRFLKPKDLPPKPVLIFALPAPVFCLVVAVTCTLVHAFGDCPLRSPAVLTLFLVTLAAMPGFLPEKGD